MIEESKAEDRRVEALNVERRKAAAMEEQAEAVGQELNQSGEGGVRATGGGNRSLLRVSHAMEQRLIELEELPERLKRSMEQVNGWVERERRGVEQDTEALANRQQAERAELDRKIEDARKLGEWREREQTHAPNRETGERHEHGRGLGGGQGGGSRGR